MDWQTGGGGSGSFFFIKGDQSVCLNYRGITTPPWGSSCQVAGKEALTDGCTTDPGGAMRIPSVRYTVNMCGWQVVKM